MFVLLPIAHISSSEKQSVWIRLMQYYQLYLFSTEDLENREGYVFRVELDSWKKVLILKKCVLFFTTQYF